MCFVSFECLRDVSKETKHKRVFLPNLKIVKSGNKSDFRGKISEVLHIKELKPDLNVQVNKQDFLQVFQGSGIGKIEDNIRSADPLSYTTTILIPGRPGQLSERLLTCKNPLHSFLWSLGSP